MIDAHMHWPKEGSNFEEKIRLLNNNMNMQNIEKGILYLIDDCDYIDENYKLNFGTNIIPSIALNIFEGDIDEKLDNVQKYGIKIIKILPYEQGIHYEHFKQVCEYAKKIQERNMILTICGSYGSKDVFKTNGVELAAAVLNSGFVNPLIVAHGGMVRQLEVHSLMCEFRNLYVDLSFTIPYWWGSHIIDDLYFMLKKDNFEHAFWGSDYPYQSYELAIQYFKKFCNKYDISQANREKILKKNFEKFYEEFIK